MSPHPTPHTMKIDRRMTFHLQRPFEHLSSHPELYEPSGVVVINCLHSKPRGIWFSCFLHVKMLNVAPYILLRVHLHGAALSSKQFLCLNFQNALPWTLVINNIMECIII